MSGDIRGDHIDRLMEEGRGGGGGGGYRGRREEPRRYNRPSRSPPRRSRRSRSRSRGSRRRPTPEEEARRRHEKEQREIDRDRRTVFASQIHPKVDEKDIFSFFSQCGRVRDVRLIRDNRTNKSKGLCYVEFDDKESVTRALAFSGQLLGGYPISVQVTQSEKNRAAAAAAAAQMDGPMRLYISNIPTQITEDELAPIFSAFGELDYLEIRKDEETKQPTGFGYVQFQKGSEARGALQLLNGLKLLGQNLVLSDNVDSQLKVSQVDGAKPSAGYTATPPVQIPGINTEQLDEGTAGVQLTAQSRQLLMKRLAQGAGYGGSGGQQPAVPPGVLVQPSASAVPPVHQQIPPVLASQFVQLRNMFDPKTETTKDWDLDIREDVEEECSKFGDVLHAHVDKNSEGHVFMKFGTAAGAQAAVNALNGRWFAQKQIVASTMTKESYEGRFPESKMN